MADCRCYRCGVRQSEGMLRSDQRHLTPSTRCRSAAAHAVSAPGLSPAFHRLPDVIAHHTRRANGRRHLSKASASVSAATSKPCFRKSCTAGLLRPTIADTTTFARRASSCTAATRSHASPILWKPGSTRTDHSRHSPVVFSMTSAPMGMSFSYSIVASCNGMSFVPECAMSSSS